MSKQTATERIADLEEGCRVLIAECDRYREALEWYANPSNWEPTINGVDIPVELDQGKTARKALKGR